MPFLKVAADLDQLLVRGGLGRIAGFRRPGFVLGPARSGLGVIDRERWDWAMISKRARCILGGPGADAAHAGGVDFHV